jgi:hypothetical protein
MKTFNWAIFAGGILTGVLGTVLIGGLLMLSGMGMMGRMCPMMSQEGQMMHNMPMQKR